MILTGFCELGNAKSDKFLGCNYESNLDLSKSYGLKSAIALRERFKRGQVLISAVVVSVTVANVAIWAVWD